MRVTSQRRRFHRAVTVNEEGAGGREVHAHTTEATEAAEQAGGPRTFLPLFKWRAAGTSTRMPSSSSSQRHTHTLFFLFNGRLCVCVCVCD